MATEKKGVWDLQQVRDQYLEGKWTYSQEGVGGELWAWGYNAYGGLGQNTTTQYSSPRQIPGTQWQPVAADYYTTLSVKTDNTLWGWGRNYYGNIGVNNVTDYSSPVQIPGTQWVDVIVGNFNFLSTKTDGTLWAWGANGNGTLGQNNRTQYSSPRQIPGTQWDFIGSSVYGSSVGSIKTDGTLWMWGGNGNAQLGLNDVTPRSSPVQIPGTQWKTVTSSDTTSVALKTDGTLWVWGNTAGYGQAGQNNTTINYSSPIQVPGTEWAAATTLNGQTSVATKTDGTLWAWGLNNLGQLANNLQTPRSSPVQIPGTQWTLSHTGFQPGYRSVKVLKTDGTLWSWGSNYAGNLGQNNGTYYSSPIQIPGTQWIGLGKATVYAGHAIKSPG